LYLSEDGRNISWGDKTPPFQHELCRKTPHLQGVRIKDFIGKQEGPLSKLRVHLMAKSILIRQKAVYDVVAAPKSLRRPSLI